MKTRTGKIARLPKPLRDQLNQRLENGEPGTSLVQWLNQLPEVQKIITEQFAGLPIRPQNLSEWRKGGYLEWIRHQLLREQTRWTAEQAAELGLDTSGASISIAEDIATVMSAELAIHVQALGDIRNPQQRFNQFRRLSLELSRLRRDDQRVISNQLRRKQPQSIPEPVEEQPVHPLQTVEPSSIIDPQPSSPPSIGGASIPPSPAPTETIDHRRLCTKTEFFGRDAAPAASPPAFSGRKIGQIRLGDISRCAAERGGDGAGAPSLPTFVQSPHRPIQLATPAEASTERASLPDSASPLPPSVPPAPKHEPPVVPETTSPTSSSRIQPSPVRKNVPCNPPLPAIPGPSDPIRPNPGKNYHDPRPPVRGRRFVCIEG